jgi:hypothetical protein
VARLVAHRNVDPQPGSPVGVVARAPDELDIFVAGNDGKTYTAAWDAHAANGRGMAGGPS